MFAQIALGILFYFFAFQHYRGKATMLRKSLRNKWPARDRMAFQRRLALPHVFLGTLFIAMGIVERFAGLSTPRFIALYMLLALPMLFFSFYRARDLYKS